MWISESAYLLIRERGVGEDAIGFGDLIFSPVWLCLEVSVESLNDVSSTMGCCLAEVGSLEVINLNFKVRLVEGKTESNS